MDTETIKEKIERLRIKAEIFLKNNTRAFIVDTSNTYHFCEILLVGEDYLYIYNFKGNRGGEKERIVWADIIRFEEYKERGEDNVE